MKAIPVIAVILFAFAPFAGAADGADRGDERSGGDTTVFLSGQSAFERPLANISRMHRREFTIGNSFFNQNWVIAPASTAGRDGLGPIFNARSCSSCHVQDGRGRPPTETETSVGLLLRLSIPGYGPHGEPVDDPVYGGQFQPLAIPGADAEGKLEVKWIEEEGRFPDGETYSLRRPEFRFKDLAYGPVHPDMLTSPRVAPAVFGLGLLEAIAEKDLLSNADPDDRDGDGISGRPNYVWDAAAERKVLGRFGWKANQPHIRQQTAGAFNGDIGITSSLFQKDHVTTKQVALRNHPDGGEPELEDRVLDRVEAYLRCLAPPARREVKNEAVLRGEELFHDIGCAKCHTSTFQTGEFPEVEELARQRIHPYTDLLLHDMGEGLADGRPDFEADGREWRTPPLWGIGLQETVNGHTFFLHDGRARNLSEAILWHGGEGEESKKKFTELPKADREAVLRFLESL